MIASSVRVAWQQLSHQRVKLAVAAAGVVVAVMLMLVQLGIRRGAINSNVAVARRITADLVVLSPRTRTMFQSSPFPGRLLHRLPAHREVDKVEELYLARATFQNPWTKKQYPIDIYGVNPRDPMMKLPGLAEWARQLELPDQFLFDDQSRKAYGPVAETVNRDGPISTEVNFREIRVIGTLSVGVPFRVDGSLYTNETNFHRLFPQRDPLAVDVGLVRLRPGADAQRVAEELAPLLGREAVIMPQPALADAEVAFMLDTSPIDFIFTMGAAVGFFIGFVVVYQILYTEVTNHLPQFATLKAMGFSDGYLRRIVIAQAFILAGLGFLPGMLLAMGVYEIATRVIQVPITMTWERAVLVLTLTMVMCSLSALIAIRKATNTDPAEVF